MSYPIMTGWHQIEQGIIAFTDDPSNGGCYADAYDMIMATRVDGGRVLRDRDAEEPHDVFVPDELFEEAAKQFSF